MVHSGGPPDRLAQRLRVARERAFVGRSAELAQFRSALAGADGAFAVLYLHGPGGVGKSTLLRRFADEARDRGRVVIEVDGRAIDPSPAGFTAEAAGALLDERTVLLVDTFERCQGLEYWLRERFLPRLPAGALVVLAGRKPPDPMWRADVDWVDALRVVALGDLDADEAVALMRGHGVAPQLYEPLLAFAGGHPLALRLAAEVAIRDGSGTAPWSPTNDVVAAVLTRLVGEVPSPAHRLALEVCAHALTTTEDLLRAVVGDAAEPVFEWLRQLPFTESGRGGVFPHDVVRKVLDADLRWRDPQGYRTMHRRIRAYFVEQVRAATGRGVMPAMRSLTYLLRHDPVFASFGAARGHGSVHEAPLRPEDRSVVVRLATEAEGPASAAIAQFWLDRQPTAFQVYRDSASGEPVAFMAWLRLAEPEDEEITADPVVALAWSHARMAGPPRPGEHLGVARYLIHPAAYQRPSPVADLMRIRVMAGWIRSDRLAWSYTVVADPTFWKPMMSYLDQHLIDATTLVGDRRYTLFVHDWRALPAETWLDLLGIRLLFGPEAKPDASTQELAVLSRTDFDAAVRDALRGWHKAEALSGNPLLRTRLVTGHAARTADPVQSLRELLVDAVDALGDDPRGAKPLRAVTATFFHQLSTQEAAAERLGLPFSTYRRHLNAGIGRVCERLWRRELDAGTR